MRKNNIFMQGRQTGGARNPPPPPPNFGEWGSTPPDFERTCCLIAHIGPFFNHLA